MGEKRVRGWLGRLLKVPGVASVGVPVLSLGFSLAVALLAAGPAMAGEKDQPTVKISEGECLVRLAGEGQPWRKVTDGQTVEWNEIVMAGRTFTGSLVYPDGTSLTLKPQTMLQVLTDGLRLHRGQAWIKVVKRGRGFTCITPSAIASVRGTEFSVEVPSMVRLFARKYRGEFFSKDHLGHGVQGPAVTLSIGLSMLAGIITEAPAGRLPATVKVYEGSVLVVYPSLSGSIKESWTLGAGEGVDTATGTHAQKTALQLADYRTWNLPVPAALLPPANSREPASRGTDVEATSGEMGLINELYDAPVAPVKR